MEILFPAVRQDGEPGGFIGNDDVFVCVKDVHKFIVLHVVIQPS